ncbi:mitogen-activated protein kinase kinase kinase 20-like [Capsicum annuum]|uniref:mitogen-activated protein kinase kinase kinase 20-like n=1 Tax=Capsicum annuum TaxID=4072 RepID=UPI001FB0F75F|nr:mitogen-activated protein kinase kinase kinase 20-like [Capsicum annuum]
MVASWGFDSDNDEVDEAALMSLGDSDLEEEDDASKESCSLKKQVEQLDFSNNDLKSEVLKLTHSEKGKKHQDIFDEVAAVKCSYIRRSSSLKLEAQILTTLKGCPNVVQFFGAALSVDNGIPTYNLFVEYACGGSLHDLIINSKKGMMKMSELEVGFYTYQLLNGILHVHKKGWVHCDIKPANVLVFDNELKLADFGLSLRVGDGMAYKTGRALSNCGTLPYAPPESLTHGFHSKAYDIWSLGCTMAEIMTGHLVWINCSTKDLQWMIMNEDPMIPTNI